MSARYYVLASDEFMASEPQWPDGLRPVEQEPTDPERHPGMHWWLFADDGAPPELNGKRVELSFSAYFDERGNVLMAEIAVRTMLR